MTRNHWCLPQNGRTMDKASRCYSVLSMNSAIYNYSQRQATHYLFLGYRWFKCQGAPGRRNERSRITLESNRGMPRCKAWSTGNGVLTTDLTGRSQRSGVKRNPRALGVPQAEPPAFAVTESRLSLSSGHTDSPTPFPSPGCRTSHSYRTSRSGFPVP